MHSLLDSLLSYNLPSERIAQRPASYDSSRDSSKLLHAQLNGASLDLKDNVFSSVSKVLREGDVLVLNNTRVIHARFFIQLPEEKFAEVLLVRPLEDPYTWECLGKPLKKLEAISNFKLSHRLGAKVIERMNEGRGLKIRLEVLDGSSLEDVIREDGYAPIPPYIRSGLSDDSDKDLYQTIYAEKEGSVAAPTAGLHFTDEIISNLKAKGVQIHYVTLHVGPYSFFPVAEDIEKSQVLLERFYIGEETFRAITQAKQESRRVIAVGTTVVRSLETVFSMANPLEGIDKWMDTQLMILPGYEFKVVQSLFTNFHQPRSTHILLVAAFFGVENMRKIYNHALNSNYRFLSYGDSSFLEKL